MTIDLRTMLLPRNALRIGLIAMAAIASLWCGLDAEAARGDKTPPGECMLPGQATQAAAYAALLALQPTVRLSQEECAARGGAYVNLDQSPNAISLRIWLFKAQAGDEVAQTKVGELFEQGVGGSPDYDTARSWYEKAAEKNFARALFNLGTLYDRGLGVSKDPDRARSYFRRATGISDLPAAGATALLSKDDARQLREQKEQLVKIQQELIRKRQEEIEIQARLVKLKDEAATQKLATGAAANARVTQLEQELAKRNDDLASKQRELDQLDAKLKVLEQKLTLQVDAKPKPGTLTVALGPTTPTIEIIDPPIPNTRDAAPIKLRAEIGTRAIVGRVTAPAGLHSLTVNDVSQKVDENGLFTVHMPLSRPLIKVTLVAVDRLGDRAMTSFQMETIAGDSDSASAVVARPNINFGRYTALIIGNQNYAQLPRLETPEADAKALADVLEKKYGFTVITLFNAKRYDILSTLNKLRANLTEKDNLLIYYAGHGEYDRANGLGHWLPVDAEPDSTANWISTDDITRMLNVMSVRHALVIADSCYSGALTRGASTQTQAGMSDEARVNWLKAIALGKSRNALTSGGVKPVLDSVGSKHSIFAQNLLDILNSNSDILETQRLYHELSTRVFNVAMKQRFDQRPEYAPLKFAGHVSGDFLFVPQ